MKISSEIASVAVRIGEAKTIELMGTVGFDAWDFSMFDMARYDWEHRCLKLTNHPLQSKDYAEFAKMLRRVGEECGMVCNQSHAPFPTCCPEIRDYLKRAIECTAIAGGKICVIHPDNNKGARENSEMFLELLPFAKEHGVKIATENMWNWDKLRDIAASAACSHHDDFLAHLNEINDEYFVACLDLGHAEMTGLNTSAREMILTLGDKLQALHIHDNDRRHDSHQIPFSMEMNFDVILTSLKEINYSGYFTLEADRYLSAYSDDEIHIGIKRLAESARRLSDMYEAL